MHHSSVGSPPPTGGSRTMEWRSAQLSAAAADGIAKNESTGERRQQRSQERCCACCGVCQLSSRCHGAAAAAPIIGVEMVDFVSEIRCRARVFLGHCIWHINPELCSNFRFNCCVIRFGFIDVYNVVYNEFWRHRHKISWSFPEAINPKCKIVGPRFCPHDWMRGTKE
jgi:hypothetical protein